MLKDDCFSVFSIAHWHNNPGYRSTHWDKDYKRIYTGKYGVDYPGNTVCSGYHAGYQTTYCPHAWTNHYTAYCSTQRKEVKGSVQSSHCVNHRTTHQISHEIMYEIYKKHSKKDGVQNSYHTSHQTHDRLTHNTYDRTTYRTGYNTNYRPYNHTSHNTGYNTRYRTHDHTSLKSSYNTTYRTGLRSSLKSSLKESVEDLVWNNRYTVVQQEVKTSAKENLTSLWQWYYYPIDAFEKVESVHVEELREKLDLLDDSYCTAHYYTVYISYEAQYRESLHSTDDTTKDVSYCTADFASHQIGHNPGHQTNYLGSEHYDHNIVDNRSYHPSFDYSQKTSEDRCKDDEFHFDYEISLK